MTNVSALNLPFEELIAYPLSSHCNNSLIIAIQHLLYVLRTKYLHVKLRQKV